MKIEWKNCTEKTIENELKKSQIKVIKTDKEDNTIRLANIKFNVLDKNKNILETIVTNKSGEALTKKYPVRDFSKLYIQEVETNEMYVLDNTIHEVELKENQVINIQLENEKIKGQIKITKVDKLDNSKLLENCEFGVYDINGNLVQKITTGKDGKAITDLLVKGKYTIKELKTGSIYYLINPNSFETEIKENKEIISIVIDNEPVDITVEVEKTGTSEIKPGEKVTYNFKNIANTSNTFLDNFKWYEYLPTDYIKINTIQTGTWNQNIKYDIYVKTNKNNEYQIFKKDLDSKINYEINLEEDFDSDEYVTEFYFDFGKVDVGFKEAISPNIICTSFDNLKDGNKFTNHTKTIGLYGDLIDDADSKWTTIVHVPEEKHDEKLPRTGF